MQITHAAQLDRELLRTQHAMPENSIYFLDASYIKSNQEVIKVPEHNGGKNISSSVAHCPQVLTTSGQLLRDHQPILS